MKTASQCSTVSVTVPIRTVSEANCREHWRVKNKRKVQQQMMVNWMFHAGKRRELDEVRWPYLVTLTRKGPRLLDDDNCQSSLKGARDMVAQILGVDDGDTKAVRWKYRQERSEIYAVEIGIQSRRRSAAPSSPAAKHWLPEANGGMA